jgi:hypothetical protein
MSDTSNPAGIERDLDETRSRLGSHLNELQDRLSPGQVLDDLMGYFRGSEGAAFGRNLIDNVRANPMPAALTGIGLAWLMASNPRPDAAGSPSATPAGARVEARLSHYGRDDHNATMVRLREAEQGVSRHPDEADHAYSARLDTARGQAVGLARHSQETAESFGERIRDALAAAEQAVTEKTRDLGNQVGGAVATAGRALGSFGATAQSTVQNAMQGATQHTGRAVSSSSQATSNLIAAVSESPILLGALGLAAGALLGALLPQSEQEEAALGGIAGQARTTATNLAKEGLERGKRVAEAVTDKARDGVQGHGVSGTTPGQLVDAALSGELAGNTKAVLQDVLQTGDEAVRQELGSSKGPGSGSPAPRPTGS